MVQHEGRLCAVIGGQYGSEGKGTVIAKIADRFDFHIRVGSHNAGHSFKHWHSNLWSTWKMQQIPVGWINSTATLILGRGALISPETLEREIDAIALVDPTIYSRLIIDADAGVLDEHHRKAEGGVEGKLHARIGSTGEGVGAARIARLMRLPYGHGFTGDPNQLKVMGFRRMRELVRDEPDRWGFLLRYLAEDTPGIIRSALRSGRSVLLEGSQGVHLSITHGRWPYVTTTDCGAAQLCADVGVPPHWLTDVLCVLRTFPIRVAGNSGPLRDEITWLTLSHELKTDVIEHTTVTNKVRRIGRWDESLVADAVTLNAPTAFAVNFLDYLDVKNAGVTRKEDLTDKTRGWLAALAQRYDTPVMFMGTGGPHWEVIEDERGF